MQAHQLHEEKHLDFGKIPFAYSSEGVPISRPEGGLEQLFHRTFIKTSILE